MKDTLINTALFITAIIVIVGATLYVSPSKDNIDYTEEIKLISEREIIDFVVQTDIFGSIVSYTYKGNELPAKLAENEVIQMRTETSFTTQIDILNEGTEEEQFILGLISYSQNVFLNEGDSWYYVQHDIVPKKIFDEATKQKSISSLFGNVVYAATEAPFAEAGDGSIVKADTSWTSAHDATIGGSADYTAASLSVTAVATKGDGEKVPDAWSIQRGFLPFDTSSIPSGSTINSATINVYVTGKGNDDNDGTSGQDGTDYITVVRTDQTSHSSLANADYNNAGATDNPTEGTDERKDITDISTSAYLVFTLNSTGLTWIQISGESSNCSSTNGISCFGLREGHDVNDAPLATPPASTTYVSGVTISSSEETGTSQDPYLSVTYTAPTSFTPWLFHAF